MILTKLQLKKTLESAEKYSLQNGVKKNFNLNQLIGTNIRKEISNPNGIYLRGMLGAFENKREIFDEFVANADISRQDKENIFNKMLYNYDPLDIEALYYDEKHKDNMGLWKQIEKNERNKNILQFLLASKISLAEKTVYFEVYRNPSIYNQLLKEQRSNPFITCAYLYGLHKQRALQFDGFMNGRTEENINITLQDLKFSPYRSYKEVLEYMNNMEKKSFEITKKDIDTFYNTKEYHSCCYEVDIEDGGYSVSENGFIVTDANIKIADIPSHFWDNELFLSEYKLPEKYTDKNISYQITLEDLADITIAMKHNPELQETLVPDIRSRLVEYLADNMINSIKVTYPPIKENFDFDTMCERAKLQSVAAKEIKNHNKVATKEENTL